MARLFHATERTEYRVLDSGAGQGELAAQVLEELLMRTGPTSVDLDLYEIDPRLAEQCRDRISKFEESFAAKGIRFRYTVHCADFIQARWQKTEDLEASGYDLIITNPPYYKLRKDSFHARLMSSLVHGQPNIYGLFLALATRLLRKDGQMVAIAPRSWLSGSYFSRIRTEVLSKGDLERIHTFRSRDRAFGQAGVLQETTIFLLRRRGKPMRPNVEVSVSHGPHDLADATTLIVPWATLCPASIEEGIRLPESIEQLSALHELDAFNQRLKDLGLRSITGPVVAFRSVQHFRKRQAAESGLAALVWIGQVRREGCAWKADSTGKQPPFMAISPATRKLLLPGEEMVLVRRFSAKEDSHRMVACRVPKDMLGSRVGIENHINVILGFRGHNGPLLATALTNYLNSELVDQYIRAVSGTTQINAKELRDLPLPGTSALIARWAYDSPIMAEQPVA